MYVPAPACINGDQAVDALRQSAANRSTSVEEAGPKTAEATCHSPYSGPGRAGGEVTAQRSTSQNRGQSATAHRGRHSKLPDAPRARNRKPVAAPLLPEAPHSLNNLQFPVEPGAARQGKRNTGNTAAVCNASDTMALGPISRSCRRSYSCRCSRNGKSENRNPAPG